MGLNLLAAQAEMAVWGKENEEPDFVLFTRNMFFERIRKEAQEQDDFAKKMAQKLLEGL